jgi:hypothetical protein
MRGVRKRTKADCQRDRFGDSGQRADDHGAAAPNDGGPGPCAIGRGGRARRTVVR